MKEKKEAQLFIFSAEDMRLPYEDPEGSYSSLHHISAL